MLGWTMILKNHACRTRSATAFMKSISSTECPLLLPICFYGADSGSISHTLEFQASASVTADDKLAAQAMLALDRTP